MASEENRGHDLAAIAPAAIDSEEIGLSDRLCLVLERHPLAVFALQAVLAVGVGVGFWRGMSRPSPEEATATPVALATEPAPEEEPTRPPVRPHARFAPERLAAEVPTLDVDAALAPRHGEDMAWRPEPQLADYAVLPPKGGRTTSPAQKAEVEREHKKFLSTLEDFLNVQGIIGVTNISPEEDPLRSPPLSGVTSMSQRIDQWVARGWHSAGVVPAPPASDEEFLRRVYLDLTGIIPTLGESRAFLLDPRTDKREQLIETLLATPAHAEHLASQWVNVMLPMDEMMDSASGANFERWLRLKFQKNIPYNRVVEDLINPGPTSGGGAAGLYNARRGMPEELAADTARILLGVQIQCAQCHNHPFDRWTVEDFKGYVAFFQDGAAFRGNPVPLRFLGGDVVEVKSLPAARRALAEWITHRDNPFFARATVNRLWGTLFGRGLVDPIDDLSPNHPPSHPQLLNELSAYFVASGYDVRGLMRVMARTRVYQLSSQEPLDDPSNGQMFASMAIKNLGVATMIDCLAQVMDDRVVGVPRPRGGRDEQLRREFLERFGLLARGGAEYEGGIPQALWMMNGPVMNQLSQSTLVRSVAETNSGSESPVFSLFLATLSRFPQPHERSRFAAHLEKQGPSRRREALADLLWALLNSAEFTMNH